MPLHPADQRVRRQKQKLALDVVHVVDHELLLLLQIADDLGQLRRREPVRHADALGQIIQDGVVKLNALGIILHPATVMRLEHVGQP